MTARACEVCGGGNSELLHRQEFLLPGDRLTHYDVVACHSCGFAYADDIPSPADYDAYYGANRKYTYEGSRNVAESLKEVHQGSFGMIDSALAVRRGRASRVLDVGCSTGSLLSCFARAGYADLLGIDPAPECRDIARRLYGVEVATASISTLAALPGGDRFDAVLLSSVLEHLPNVRASVGDVAALVAERGLLFVQVPDAERFGVDLKEPFLEFSIEHIGYFTRASLGNILASAGFAPAALRQEVLLSNGTAYPVITALFEADVAARGRPIVPSDPAPLREYVARCTEKLSEIRRVIASFVASGEELVVWGTGSLTARLLATTDFAHMNIARFVDSNSSLHGSRLAGREIVPPASLRGATTTVFVSSYVYGEAIRRTLLDEYDYRGRIVVI